MTLSGSHCVGLPGDAEGCGSFFVDVTRDEGEVVNGVNCLGSDGALVASNVQVDSALSVPAQKRAIS